MTMIQQHPASIDAYIRHGWSLVPIPYGSKGPRNSGWNRPEAAVPNEAALPQGYGIGLAHAYSGTMALDIDAWDDAAALLSQHGINLPALYDAPDAVIIDSGRQGRGKLLYTMPFGLRLPSRKINQSGQTIYELRCATADGLTVQDVLPPSIHPDTNQPYRWAGKGHWSRLPTIPTELLTLWQSMLEQDSAVNATRIEGTGEGELDVNWNELTDALHAIDPDVSREEWIMAGMALHWAGTLAGREADAFNLWNSWSEQGVKYPGERQMLTQWRSFKADKQTTVRLGSLLHLARNNGWTRPMPDTTELFSATTPPAQPDTTDITTPAPTALSPEDIIDGLRPPAPEFPLHLMPEIIRVRAQEISESVGCDPLVPAFAGLAVAAGAADARTRLELLDGFKVPPILWMMTIGHPADKKTPGSSPMMRILQQLEGEDRENFARAMLEWEGRNAFRDTMKEDYIRHMSTGEGALGADAPQVPDQEAQPVPKRLLVADITSQKLGRILSDRPEGVLCYLDEMRGWCKKMTDEKSIEDRSTWVQSYEARDHYVDRIGSGSIHIKNMAVAVYGNVQPRVFRETATKMSSDGLLQRFIPGVLHGKYTRKPSPLPAFLTHHDQYEQAIRVVHGMPTMHYKLSPDAFTLYDQFQDWYIGAKRDERLINVSNEGEEYLTAFGKLEGLAGRLILIWHMLESPFNLFVSAETVRKVLEFVRCYVVPSYRYVYQVMGGAAEDSFDVWLTNYVIQCSGEETSLTLRQILRSARRQLTNVSKHAADRMVIDAMHVLEHSGWVTIVEQDIPKRNVSWAINPAIPTMFKEYRLEVIKAKQRQRDEMRKAMENAKGIKIERNYVKGYDPDTMD